MRRLFPVQDLLSSSFLAWCSAAVQAVWLMFHTHCDPPCVSSSKECHGCVNMKLHRLPSSSETGMAAIGLVLHLY